MNKSKIMKHNDDVDTVQQYFVEPEPQQNANAAELPVKYFPLKSIPLYHAYYHQHMYNASNSLYEPVRNRSSITKRASSEKKQISTNITMVLEDLLKWVLFSFFMFYQFSRIPIYYQMLEWKYRTQYFAKNKTVK